MKTENIVEKTRKVPLMRPFLPPLEQVLPYLESIWETRILTNGGPFQVELEKALCCYLGVKYISLFSSGTLALIIALRALEIDGEVITTPFTFQATRQALLWNNLTPVYADIDPNDLNISPEAIEAAITPRTAALLPVHIYGKPCAIGRIIGLAEKYGLRLIFDAAQSFGSTWQGVPVCRFGELSVLSFHATKVFNTFEGGAVVSHDESMKERIDALKNNGLSTGRYSRDFGINAKLTEFQAAIGLCQLAYTSEIIALRKAATEIYRHTLDNIRGLRLLPEKDGAGSNYSFLPVFLDMEEFGGSRDELCDYLIGRGIGVKKYFSPLVSDFSGPFPEGRFPVAKQAASSVLCLPLFHDISETEIHYVTEAIRCFHNCRR